jgi:hypothetical protein
MSNPAPEQHVLDNLTTRQNLVRQHTGLDSLPGYTVVVFEKPDRGGEIFHRLMKPGERYQSKLRLPFWDPTRGYFAVAVNRAVLSHSFDMPVALDDHVHKFTLNFHFKYRAADPQRVAELREQNPLGQLRDEVARVIVRSCSQRKWEMVRDRFRELEMVVLNGERAGLVRYAATLGLEIISLELDKRLPEDDEEVQLALSRRQAEIEKLKVKVEADVEKEKFKVTHQVDVIKEKAKLEWEHERNLQELGHQFDKDESSRSVAHRRELSDIEHEQFAREKQLDGQIAIQDKQEMVDITAQRGQLRDSFTKAASKALETVAGGVDSPREFKEAFDVAREITMTIQGDAASSHPNGLPPGFVAKSLGEGEDKPGGLLIQATMEINRLTCPDAQKRSLRSAMLHVVAEALLDDHADEEVLKKYADKVSEVGKKLQPPLTPSQFRFFETFIKYEQLRNDLR